jgi:hypothetical protein
MPRSSKRIESFSALTGAGSMCIAVGSQVAALPWGQQGWVYNQPDFGASAATWAHFYADNRVGTMVGTAGFEVAWALMLYFSIQLALMLWRMSPDTGSRIITAVTASAQLTIPFLMMLVTAFWTAAAYRAADADPQVTRALSDLGYLGSFIWFYTAVMAMGLTGWLILRVQDRNENAFPAWVGWFSIVCSMTQLPAIGVQFTYSGVFSLNGIVGWYIPLGGWIVWMMVISPLMYRMVNSEARRDRINHRHPEPSA